jgi:transcriptional regulator with XRE-family HTH domain
MSKKTFGDRLRRLRLQCTEYQSLRDFARKVGLSPTYLSHIENNKVPPPSEEVIERLAAALHVDEKVKYELYSLGDKVPLEFLETFKKNPLGLADFLRTAESAGIHSDQDWARLKKEALKMHEESE